MEASCWVARKIFLSAARASSRARTLDSRPTTNGVIIKGKMTTSRMGIIGSFFDSNFSLDVVTQSPRSVLNDSQCAALVVRFLQPKVSLLSLPLSRLLQCGHGSAAFLDHLPRNLELL